MNRAHLADALVLAIIAAFVYFTFPDLGVSPRPASVLIGARG